MNPNFFNLNKEETDDKNKNPQQETGNKEQSFNIFGFNTGASAPFGSVPGSTQPPSNAPNSIFGSTQPNLFGSGTSQFNTGSSSLFPSTNTQMNTGTGFPSQLPPLTFNQAANTSMLPKSETPQPLNPSTFNPDPLNAQPSNPNPFNPSPLNTQSFNPSPFTPSPLNTTTPLNPQPISSQPLNPNPSTPFNFSTLGTQPDSQIPLPFASSTTPTNTFAGSSFDPLKTPDENTANQEQISLSKEIPLNFRQKTLNEITTDLTKKLEENIQDFLQKANEIFKHDEKIIKARNNYVKILSMIEEEEKKITEMEENVDFFHKWLSDFKEEVGSKGVREDADELKICIGEIEKLVDEYNYIVESVKDEDDEVMCLVNENLNLIKTIDNGLDTLSGGYSI